MNKTELIDAIASAAELSKVAAQRALEATLDSIARALEQHDSVSIVNFGTFQVSERAARTGRNPQTGEPIMIKARKSPVFKAGKALKDAVEGVKK
jgi:nucleoid DNA-binding protein